MCWGGGGSKPQQQPTPAPTPSPTPTETAPVEAADQRRARLKMVRQGIASTIKTSGQGITGSGSNLGQDKGKTTLGS